MDCKINKLLLPIKLTYFFTLAAVASLLPYMGVYMKQIGLSQSETGIIYGVMPIVGALVRPLLGVIADKAQKHKLTLLLCVVICGGFFAACYFVPEVKKTDFQIKEKVHPSLKCSKESPYISICSKPKVTSSCVELSDDYSMSNCHLDCSFKDTEKSVTVSYVTKNYTMAINGINGPNQVFIGPRIDVENVTINVTAEVCTFYDVDNSTRDRFQAVCVKNSIVKCQMKCPQSKKFGITFWLFFILFLIGNIAFSPIFSLIDAMTYSYLGEQRRKWGKQRLFGTIGFALAAVMAGFMMDTFRVRGTESSNNYLYSFIAYPVFSILAAVSVWCYKIDTDVTCRQMCAHVGSLLCRLDVNSFLICVQLFGMFTGVIETFLFWHLKELCAPQILFGVSMFVNCLPEVPILFLAGWIMKQIGEINCLFIVFFAYGLRFLGYFLLTNPWFVLFLEPLHGITFGLMYAAASSYASSITPPGMHGTIQGLIGGIHFGTGKGLGSVFAGLAYERFGAVRTFQGCAVIAVASLIIYFLLHKLVIKAPPLEEKEDKVEKDEGEEMIDVKKPEEEKPEETEPMVNGVKEETPKNGDPKI